MRKINAEQGDAVFGFVGLQPKGTVFMFESDGDKGAVGQNTGHAKVRGEVITVGIGLSQLGDDLPDVIGEAVDEEFPFRFSGCGEVSSGRQGF